VLVDKNKVTRLDIPHEPGQWVEVALLTGLEMDEAEGAAEDRVLNKYGKNVDIFAKIAKLDVDSGERPTPEPHTEYDALTVLRYGVRAWSYPEPVTPENLEALDVATRDFLHREIVAANTRPLVSVKNTEPA